MAASQDFSWTDDELIFFFDVRLFTSLNVHAKTSFCWFSSSFLSASIKVVFFVVVFSSDFKPLNSQYRTVNSEKR